MTTQAIVRLSLSPDGAEVVVGSSNIGAGLHGELTLLLIAHGGIPTPDGFHIPTLGFRRCAVDFAAILRDEGVQVEYNASVEHLLRTHLGEIRARQEAETDDRALDVATVQAEIEASGRFVRELTRPQLRDVSRLVQLRHGANYSVPGAGKTTSLLAIYEVGRNRGDVARLSVVAPKNAFVSWETELARCYLPELLPAMVRLAGGRAGVAAELARDPEIALISYQLLPNVLDLVQTWLRRQPTHVVLDESHRIKGGLGGVIASSALQLSDIAQRRDILSGTPLPQAPEDLRPQFDFLWPGQRILPETRLEAESPMELLNDVQESVRPLYVRTTKQELDLPPLYITPAIVELGPLQRELYELLRSEARRLASGMPAMDRRFFRSLGRHVVRLLQVASNPMLLTHGELVDEESVEPLPSGMRAWELLRDFSRYEQPAKITAAVQRTNEILASDSSASVLIWTSFVLNIDLLERLLTEHNPVTLYGAVETGDANDPNTREGRIRRFHEDTTCRVMIANPAAGGEGISLHEVCHYALYLDRTFNAAHYLQSLDRIHRLGLLPETVTRVEVLDARNTIDQRVAQRLRVKLDAMAHILADPGLTALAYDPEDVVEEFPAGLEPEDVEEVVDHLFELQRESEDA